MLTDTEPIAVGKVFPPACEKARLADLHDLRMLYDGKHADYTSMRGEKHKGVFHDAFKRLEDTDEWPPITRAMALPWPRKVAHVFANLLVGEPPRVRATDDAQQEDVEDLVRRLKLWRVTHEVCVDAGRYGDGLYKLRLKDGRPSLSCQPPQYWFPVVDPSDIREVVCHVLAWTWDAGTRERPDWRGKAEYHTAGSVRTVLFALDASPDRGGKITSVAEDSDTTTGIDSPMVFHVPNRRGSEELHGHADFDDCDSILANMEIRAAGVDRVLDKHTDPTAYGPEGGADIDEETGQPVWKASRYVEVPAGETPPGYTVFDGQLAANFLALNFCREELYSATDTCAALVGKTELGHAESGSALRRELTVPLAKVNFYRLVFDDVVQSLLAAAAELDGWTLEGVNIIWRDGLPEDPLESAQVEQLRSVAGNTSPEDSIGRLDGLEGDELARAADRAKATRNPLGSSVPSASQVKLMPAANPPPDVQAP